MPSKKVRYIPTGYKTVTPYLAIDGASAAIAFYKKAFGAKEVMRMPGPKGTIGHAEISIDDCRIMLADEFPEMNFRSPRAFGGTPVGIHLYVKNVDAVAKKAVAAGAKLVRPVTDQFYGDRSASLEDPFGHLWHVATHVKDVSLKEMKKQATTLAAAEKS
jgi:PhnB protein